MYSKLVTRSGANTPDEIRRKQLANVKRRGAEMQQQEEKRKAFQRYMNAHMEQTVARREYLASAQSSEDRDEFLAKWDSDRGGFMTECYNNTKTIIESFKTRDDLKQRALAALGKWKQGIQRFEDARVRMSEYPIGHPEHTRLGIEMSALQVSYYTQVRVHEVELQTTLNEMRDEELGSPIDIERYAVREIERRMVADGATPEQLEAHRKTYAATLRLQTAEAHKKMMLHPGGVHCGLMLPVSVDELNATEHFYVQADLWANLASTEFYTKAFPMSKVMEEATGVAFKPQLRGPVRSTDRLVQLLGKKAQGLRNMRMKKRKDRCRTAQRPLGSGDGIREDGVRIEESDDEDEDFFDVPELGDLDDDFFNDVREHLPKNSGDVIDADGIFYDVQEEKTGFTQAEATALAAYFKDLQMIKRQRFPPTKPPKTQDAFGRMLLDPMVLLDKIATPLTDSVQDDIRLQKDNMVAIFYESLLAKLNNPLGLNSRDLPYLKKLMRFGRTTALFLNADWDDPDYATERLPADFKEMVRPELVAYLEATRDARSLLTVDALRKIFDFETSSDKNPSTDSNPNPVSSSGRIFSGGDGDGDIDDTITNPDAPSSDGFSKRLTGAVVGLAISFSCYYFRGAITNSTFDSAYQIATTAGHVGRSVLSNAVSAREQVDILQKLTTSMDEMKVAANNATDALLKVQEDRISAEARENIEKIRRDQAQILATANTMSEALQTNFQHALAGGIGSNLLLANTEGIAFMVSEVERSDEAARDLRTRAEENKLSLNAANDGNVDPSHNVVEMMITNDSCRDFESRVGEIVHLLGEYAIENDIQTLADFFLSSSDPAGKKDQIFNMLRGCTNVVDETIKVSERTATAMALKEFQRETGVMIDAMEKSLEISSGNQAASGEYTTRMLKEFRMTGERFVTEGKLLTAKKYEIERGIAQDAAAADALSDTTLENNTTGSKQSLVNADDSSAPPISTADHMVTVVIEENQVTTNADGSVSNYVSEEAYSLLDPKLFLKVTSFENLINATFDMMVEQQEDKEKLSLDLAREKVNRVATRVNEALSAYKDGLRKESKNQIAAMRRVFKTLRLHASIAGTKGATEMYPQIIEMFGDQIAVPGSKMAIDTTQYLESIHLEAETKNLTTSGIPIPAINATEIAPTHSPTDAEKWSRGMLAVFEAFKEYSGNANTFASSPSFTSAIKKLGFVMENGALTSDGVALQDVAVNVQTVVNPRTIQTNTVANSIVFNLTVIPNVEAPNSGIGDWITSGEKLVSYIENMETDIATNSYGGDSARLMKIPGYAPGENPYQIAKFGSEYMSFVSLTGVISSVLSLVGLGIIAASSTAATATTTTTDAMRGATTATLGRKRALTDGSSKPPDLSANSTRTENVDPSRVDDVADVLVGAWFDGRANTAAFANALRARAEGTMATYVYHAQATTEILSRGDVRELFNYVRSGPQGRTPTRTQPNQPNLIKRVLAATGMSQEYLDGIDMFFQENSGYRNAIGSALLVSTLLLASTGWVGLNTIALGTGLSLSAKSPLFAGTVGPAAATLFASDWLAGGRIISSLGTLMSLGPYLATFGVTGYIAIALGSMLGVGALTRVVKLNTLIDLTTEIFSEVGIPSVLAVTAMSIALHNHDNDLLYDSIRHLLQVAQFTLTGTVARAITQGLVRRNGTLNKDILYNVTSEIMAIDGFGPGIYNDGAKVKLSPETVEKLGKLTMATDNPSNEDLAEVFDADEGIFTHTRALSLAKGDERTAKIHKFHRDLYDLFKTRLLFFNSAVRNNMAIPVMTGAMVQIALHFFLNWASPIILAGAINGANTGSAQLQDMITYLSSDFTKFLNVIGGSLGHGPQALIDFTFDFEKVTTLLGNYTGSVTNISSGVIMEPIDQLLAQAVQFTTG